MTLTLLRRAACLAVAGFFASATWAATTWTVAPGQSLVHALRQASDGDVIELQTGVHKGQVGVITQRVLTVRGVGGPVVLQADGQHAEGKAILVVRNGEVRIENIEFRGARVPDGNGAGIRFERGKLIVSGCAFFDNEMGLLTANVADAELTVLNSRFGQAPTQQKALAHLLYVGDIARFTLQGSHFSGGLRGHLVKSRARENRVLYNALADGAQGQASYELEFPNGGVALVMGNVIQQGVRTQNRAMLAFGAEGEGASGLDAAAPRQHYLVLAHNTFVNDSAAAARFVQIHSARLRQAPQLLLQNNLFLGPGDADGPWTDQAHGNYTAPLRHKLPVRGRSPFVSLIGTAVPAASALGQVLRPTAQFQDPAGTKPLAADRAWSPGATQD